MLADAKALIGRHRRAVLAAGIAMAAGIWFLWPAIAGGAGDVAVIADGSVDEFGQALGTHVRDRGHGFVELAAVTDMCGLAAGLHGMEMSDAIDTLVIAVAERGSCLDDPLTSVLGQLDQRGIEAVVVVFPGQDSPAADVRMVLAEQLIGAPDEPSMPCEWWDECPVDGVVQVRSAGGEVTAVGADRMARMVAATIG